MGTLYQFGGDSDFSFDSLMGFSQKLYRFADEKPISKKDWKRFREKISKKAGEKNRKEFR